jgi:hypothetical protein
VLTLFTKDIKDAGYVRIVVHGYIFNYDNTQVNGYQIFGININVPGIRGEFDYWNTAPYYEAEPVEVFATLGVPYVYRLPAVTDQQGD